MFIEAVHKSLDGQVASMKTATVIALATLLLPSAALAQRGRGAGPPAAPPAPRAAAPVDITGYWVSVVTEDWRYRMVMPAKGDYQGVPLTPAARKIADSWDPAKEAASGEPCKAYGAPAILRVPGRLHITWQDDQTLKLETDAGQQTRLFHFGAWKSPGGPRTLQGDSVAEWEGGGRGATDGSMKVTTTNLKAGFLRKNGVPYGENASLTEDLRSRRAARRIAAARGHHRDDRSGQPARPVRDQLAVQEGIEQCEVEAVALLGDVVST